jgi:hypothetical protein
MTVFSTCHLDGVTSAPVPVQRAVEKGSRRAACGGARSLRGADLGRAVGSGSQRLLGQLDATVFQSPR